MSFSLLEIFCQESHKADHFQFCPPTQYAIEALNMALSHGKAYDLSKLIHRSDRGVQYASYTYTDILKSNGISISMTESGNPRTMPGLNA